MELNRTVVAFGGAATAVVAVGSLVALDKAPAALAIAVIGLVAGGWIAESLRIPGLAVALVASAGLVLVEPFPDRPLFRISTTAFVVVVGLSVADFERRRGRITAVMMFASFAGIYLAVPSPDEALVLLLAGLLLVVLPEIRLRGALPLAGLMVWVAAVGGAPRTGSIVGAFACIGILLIEPVSRAVLSRIGTSGRLMKPEDVSPRLLLAAHLLVVTLASRVSGFREKSEAALLIALMVFALGWSIITLRTPRLLQRWVRPL